MSDKPSYFSILTAAVRYDKNLCANAKLLYSEITALTQKEGYCWATNQHFADLYEVDVSTIKRWISDLEKNGHLEIHTEKVGMRWDRKMYVKNVYEGSKRSLTKAQNKDYQGLKNEPIITQEFNNKENNNENVVVVPLCLKNLGIPKDLQIRLTKQYGDDLERIENACMAVTKMKPRNMEATIQDALKKSYKPSAEKEDVVAKNRAWTDRNFQKYDAKDVGPLRCNVLPTGIEFSGGNGSLPKHFPYEDISFQKEVTEFMNKLLKI